MLNGQSPEGLSRLYPSVMSCPLPFWAPVQITNRKAGVPVPLILKIYEQPRVLSYPRGVSFQIPRAFQKSDSITLLLCILTALIWGKHVAHLMSEFCRLRDNSEGRLWNSSLSTEELGIEFSLRSTGEQGLLLDQETQPGGSRKWSG